MHTLLGGGGQHGGFDALYYQRIRHGDAGKLGNYPILAFLPDKMARFLYEFHAFRFESLGLPPLPADRSNFDVHGAIGDEQVPYLKHGTLLFMSELIVFLIDSIMCIICIIAIIFINLNRIPLFVIYILLAYIISLHSLPSSQH